MADNNEKRLEYLRGLEKLKGSKVKSDDYTSPLDQDKIVVKGKPQAPEQITRIKGATDKIDTKGIGKLSSGSDFQSKIASLLQNRHAKKALGVIPMAGTVAGLMAGDPAMAAEEAAGDIVPGLEAVKSEDAGMSSGDERMMLAEDQARKNYAQSPARLAKLQAMMGSRPQPSSSPSLRDTGIAKSLRDQLGEEASEGLAMDQIPHEAAGAPSSDEVAPEMEGMLQDELAGADEIDQRGLREARLRKLFNPK